MGILWREVFLELTMGENPNVNWGLEDLSSIL